MGTHESKSPRAQAARPSAPRRRAGAPANRSGSGRGTAALCALCLAVFALLVCFMLTAFIPALPVSSAASGVTGVTAAASAGTALSASAAASRSADLSLTLDTYANNAASAALSDLTYIKKIYTIDADALTAPAPRADGWGSSSDPAEVRAVIDSAARLLDGQETVWTEDTELYPGGSVTWYCDETILVLHWQEVYDNCVYNFAEIKIADASQFRRMLAGNSYGASIQLPLTEMAAQSNAVIATNGDFYIFRAIGTNVYRGQLYDFGGKLDTCFIDASGDLHCVKAGTLTDEDAILAYIDENDIRFSLNFGPVLVEDGQACAPSSYPIGEITTSYARSAIGQLGELHYLLMTAGCDHTYPRSAVITDSAAAMAAKGCVTAYALDGGQTAEQVMNGQIMNRVVYDAERNVSDMIYFATALPEGD